jgi:hypothetical protein
VTSVAGHEAIATAACLDGGARGCVPGRKVSMMVMMPPQCGHGSGLANGGSLFGGFSSGRGSSAVSAIRARA